MDKLSQIFTDPSVLVAVMFIRMAVEIIRRMFRINDEMWTKLIVYLTSASVAHLWNINLTKIAGLASPYPLVDLAANAILLGYVTMIGHDALDKLAGK